MTEKFLIEQGWEIVSRERWKPGVMKLGCRMENADSCLFQQFFVDEPADEALREVCGVDIHQGR